MLISAFPKLDLGGGLIVDDVPKIIDLKTFKLLNVQNTKAPTGYKKMLSTHFSNPLKPNLIQFVHIFETPWNQISSSADYKIRLTEFDNFSGLKKVIFENDLKGRRFSNMLFVKEDANTRKTSLCFLADWYNGEGLNWWNFHRGPNPHPHASLIMNYDMVTGLVKTED